MNITIIQKIQLALVGVCILMAGMPLSTNAAGLLTPKDGSLPALDIKDHNIKVVIEDGYAITTVTQVFTNPNPTDLEEVYSFPVPEKAAVSEFTMWIDGKPIHGEVLEKKKARAIYDEQKSAGNDAGITEKDSTKTFDISVSPVRAGQDTKIRLSYIQPAHIDTGIGSYVYPLEEGGVDEQKLSFWTAKETVINQFSFDLILRSSYPVEGLRLPNHPQASIKQEGKDWHVHIGNDMQNAKEENANTQAAYSLDKDITVYYRHADNIPGSVDLVTYKPDADKRGTFMLTVTPGMDLKPITEGKDWVFVLDISGSMKGKYQTLAEGVSRALKKMSQSDRFRIVLFNNHPSELTKGYINATAENVQYYINTLSAINPFNGTDVFSGLKMALNGLDADRTAAIILVTDGVANIGVTQQKKFIELVQSKDIRLFTFIMGNSANRPLLNAMTDASGGFAMSVSNSDDIVGKILLAQNKVTHEALHGSELTISGIKTFDVTPGKIGSLYHGQQLVMFGHYTEGGKASISLQGKVSGEKKHYSTIVEFPAVSNNNPEIERLWAFSTIEALSSEMANFGENADLTQAVTDLGVEYSLVTDNTSMVVVKEEVFKKLAIDRKNQRRLEREFSAAQKRENNTVQNHRVDTQQPMFTNARPTTRGGGGSLDGWFILLMLPLIVVIYRNKKKGEL